MLPLRIVLKGRQQIFRRKCNCYLYTVGQIMDLGDEPLLMRTCRGGHFDRFHCKQIAIGLTVKNWRKINDTLKTADPRAHIVSIKVA